MARRSGKPCGRATSRRRPTRIIASDYQLSRILQISRDLTLRMRVRVRESWRRDSRRVRGAERPSVDSLHLLCQTYLYSVEDCADAVCTAADFHDGLGG